MKVRVIIRGMAVCAVVWCMVFVAQAYFRGLRITAENLGKVVNEDSFKDWSRGGEPRGEEARVRELRIREVASMMGKLEFAEDAKARERALKSQFYAKLSGEERVLFVRLLIEQLEPYVAAFDALPPDRREKFIKKMLKEADYALAPEQVVKLKLAFDENVQGEVAENGLRAVLDSRNSDEVMVLVPGMEIMYKMIQRIRVPKWEGRDDDD